MAEPFISVIVPIYNVEKYLRQTLGSLAAQQMEELEFVCVDDCSTDGSAAIIAEFAAGDSRFKPIYFDSNKNVSQARKEGVLASRGKYIMFLDGDDYYEPDACARLYAQMEAQRVDVMQFGTNIICENAALAANVEKLKSSLNPYARRVEAEPEELLEMVFAKKLWSFNLWNKIYRREVCVKGFSAVEDGVFRNGEDLYAYFLITHFSRSYMGVEGLKCYNYCYGRGLYGHAAMDLDRFSAYCSQARVTGALYRFIGAHGLEERYGRLVDLIEARFIGGVAYNWRNTLKPSEHARGFDVMCAEWGVEKTIAAVAKQYRSEKQGVAESVYGAKAMERRIGKIRTIAMYYHWMVTGGVERVMSSLSFMWTEMGYNVVLITDTEPTEGDFPVAPGIKRVVIKDFRECNADNYIERARSLAAALRENNVDAVDYNAWVNPMLLWDLLLIKSMGIAFCYHTHSVSTHGLHSLNTSINDRMAVCRLMDGIACLSRVDELLFRCANPNSHYIANPIDAEAVAKKPAAALDGRTILWSGRFSHEKNPMDVVKMFKGVIERAPDARLVMLGDGKADIVKAINDYIDANGLRGSVELPGFVKNVDEYYLKASVLVGTSKYEGFPMVFLESCAYGLPIVTYALDYLELARECSIISVPQNDIAAMTEAVTDILLDDEGRRNLGAKLRREALKLAGEDLRAKWKAFFDGVEKGTIPPEADETQRLLISTMLQQYAMGVKDMRENALGGLTEQMSGGANAKKTAEICNNIGAQNLARAVALDNNADLNDVIKAGTYALVNNGKTRFVKNCPPGAYKLVVDTVTGTSIRQTLIASGSMNTFVRIWVGGDWKPWKNVSLKACEDRLDALERLWIIRLERKARGIARRIREAFKGKR